jgi:glycyl-tRNA synthetase
MDGGRYVVAVVRQAGRSAVDVLSEALPEFIASLRFDKTMRWNSSNVAFSRPIRWLLALFGEGDNCQVVPFEYAGVSSGRKTRGLRFSQSEWLGIRSPQEYFETMETQGIVLDVAERQRIILEKAQTLASEVGGVIPDDRNLLAEVGNLVEAPAVLRGSFDPQHLNLPKEVLISVMKKHQRYFPIVAAAGKTEGQLLPYFIATPNGERSSMALITHGNEHVIRARFADAAYFVRDDLKKPLEAYLPKLDTLTFQVRLGSMLDKVHRIVALVSDLAKQVGLNEEQLAVARRAALLCKADLATQMVVEMTSLQGQMGRYYALSAGESEAVALAIYEHYLPRYAGDDEPTSLPGLAIGLADRMDSLVGLFAADKAPSGNKDPFAQRRAALGLVQNLLAWDLDFDLRSALNAAATHLPIEASIKQQEAVQVFIVERLRNVLLDEGMRYDVVDAVLAAQGWNPARATQAVKALTSWVARQDWDRILPAYSRCVRITRDLEERYSVDEEVFAEAPERALYAALKEAEKAERKPGSVDDFLNAFVPMIPAIDRFFDDVLVMAEDESLRRNRLGLLQRIAALADGVADMSKLEGF